MILPFSGSGHNNKKRRTRQETRRIHDTLSSKSRSPFHKAKSFLITQFINKYKTQGWNSSWDRAVSEEYILKDTPENRQLQKDLAEKSQLQMYVNFNIL